MIFNYCQFSKHVSFRISNIETQRQETCLLLSSTAFTLNANFINNNAGEFLRFVNTI